MTRFLIVLVILVSMMRVLGVHEMLFQATEFLYMGGLIGRWLGDRRQIRFLLLGLCLIFVEGFCLFFGTIR